MATSPLKTRSFSDLHALQDIRLLVNDRPDFGLKRRHIARDCETTFAVLWGPQMMRITYTRDDDCGLVPPFTLYEQRELAEHGSSLLLKSSDRHSWSTNALVAMGKASG